SESKCFLSPTGRRSVPGEASGLQNRHRAFGLVPTSAGTPHFIGVSGTSHLIQCCAVGPVLARLGPRLGPKDISLGGVEATSQAEAIAKGAEEFKQPKERLMAVRRG